MNNEPVSSRLYDGITTVIRAARGRVRAVVNSAMVERIGKLVASLLRTNGRDLSEPSTGKPC